MFDENRLKKTILHLKKIKAPYVVVEIHDDEIANELQDIVEQICSEIGLQIYCEHELGKITIRNLFYSNN